MIRLWASIFIAVILSGCCHDPNREIKRILSHHDATLISPLSPYFLIILVDARQLDYTSTKACLRSLVKHPSDGSKNSDVGHAWIYLKGEIDGLPYELEGGQTGELGLYQPKYFEGIMNYVDFGYSHPSQIEKVSPRYEPNPVKYLWEDLHDGYFQKESGGHRPTFAIKVELTSQQFDDILTFISQYSFERYSLVQHQCCSFVIDVAALVGLELDATITMPIDPFVRIGGDQIRLWIDPCYSQLRFLCPERLEYSMLAAAQEGRATSALDWYLKYRSSSFNEKCYRTYDDLKCFPARFYRFWQFNH
jgi:hypothetical protein